LRAFALRRSETCETPTRPTGRYDRPLWSATLTNAPVAFMCRRILSKGMHTPMVSIVENAPQRTSAVNDRNMSLRLRLIVLVQPDPVPIVDELRQLLIRRLDGDTERACR